MAIVSSDCRSKILEIDVAADYVIQKFLSDGAEISVLKLQKLLYYIQAWHLVFYNQKLINTTFEAWAHGPCIPALYSRLKYEQNLYLYSCIKKEHLTSSPEELKQLADSENINNHIDAVLDKYGGLSGIELEILTHKEPPWQNARGDIEPFERCETVISDDAMKEYYRSLLPSDEINK